MASLGLANQVANIAVCIPSIRALWFRQSGPVHGDALSSANRCPTSISRT